ncbi:MAG: hypothetical protein QOH06_4398 [Acidobacteriota bacterium]|jgi:hypothetical protein|nr:hypothetical protein [Acidobacteriota bacterium]
MTLGKKSLTFPAQLPILVCVAILLLGVNTAEAQIRTVTVSPVPGNPIASGTALRNALAGISAPSSTDRWLLKIEPGIYDIGTISLQMRSWVDIEGSGIGVTTVRGSVDALATNYQGTINGADNAELRLLTVEAQGSSSIALANIAASPRLYRLKLVATAANVWGIRNTNGSAPLIEECEVVATSTSTSGTFATGILFKGFPPAGKRSSILRSTIVVSGAATNYGVNMLNAQTVTLIRDSRMDVVGGTTTYGISAAPNGAWSGNESLQIRNTEISSVGGSSASYGINILYLAWISFDINGSRIWGHVSPLSYGIVQGDQGPMGIQGSSVTGFTQTVQTAGSISIASTLLQGGPATAQGWIGCMGVWDENAIFYAQGACP